MYDRRSIIILGNFSFFSLVKYTIYFVYGWSGSVELKTNFPKFGILSSLSSKDKISNSLPFFGRSLLKFGILSVLHEGHSTIFDKAQASFSHLLFLLSFLATIGRSVYYLSLSCISVDTFCDM